MRRRLPVTEALCVLAMFEFVNFFLVRDRVREFRDTREAKCPCCNQIIFPPVEKCVHCHHVFEQHEQEFIEHSAEAEHEHRTYQVEVSGRVWVALLVVVFLVFLAVS